MMMLPTNNQSFMHGLYKYQKGKTFDYIVCISIIFFRTMLLKPFRLKLVGPLLFLVHIIVAIITIIFIIKFDNSSIQRLLPAWTRKLRQKRSGLVDSPKETSISQVELVPNRYWIYKRRANWSTAGQLCQQDQRSLATFEDKADAELVIDALHSVSHFSLEYDRRQRKEELGLDRAYWIGLFDFGHEGQWEWLNLGFLTYQDLWYKNQPDHVLPDGKPKSNRPQHCVSLWNPIYYKDSPARPRKHTFDDKECTYELYFICGWVDPAVVQPPMPEPPPLPPGIEPPPPTAPAPPPRPKVCPTKCGNPDKEVPERLPDGSLVCVDMKLMCRAKTKCDSKCIDQKGRPLAEVTVGNSQLLWNCIQKYLCPMHVVTKLQNLAKRKGWKADDAH